eukprot:c12218_g1_i1.p1 GENE.c12218_g1_i1~~c12218_g1_i1.p1  ORF type:complete len:227 (-),score=55.86 c12218_g1_i1:207-887(-)
MGCHKSNLRYLTSVFLNKTMSKAHQMTNWEVPHLTTGQLEYAALDAWASREVYVQMLRRKTLFEEWIDRNPDAVAESNRIAKLKPYLEALTQLRTFCSPTSSHKISIQLKNSKTKSQFKFDNFFDPSKFDFDTVEDAHDATITLTVAETAKGKGETLIEIASGANQTYAMATAALALCPRLVKKKYVQQRRRNEAVDDSLLVKSAPPPSGLTVEHWNELLALGRDS